MAIFGQKGRALPTYLLMTQDSRLLARGELTSPPDGMNMQIKIIEGKADDVVAAETVQAISVDENYPMRLGRVILRRGNLIVLEPLQDLSYTLRQNLRMPVNFDSFVYPRAGGRAPIRGENLSCGGIAFFTAHPFQSHEQFEVVIPITEEGPLIVDAEILRQSPCGETTEYAAKFVDLIHDQEAKLREAVFHVQLSGRG